MINFDKITMKNTIYLICFLLPSFIGCKEEIKIDPTSYNWENCQNYIEYTEEEYTTVFYLPNEENLTVGERALKTPKKDSFEISICHLGNGAYVKNVSSFIPIEINNSKSTLGRMPVLAWRSITQDGITQTYDENNNLINSAPSNTISLFGLETLEIFTEGDLMPTDMFNSLISELTTHLGIVQSNNISKFRVDVSNSEKIETHINNKLQRTISQMRYDNNGNLLDMTRYYYDVFRGNQIETNLNSDLTGCKIKLRYKVFEVYTPSPYSDKTIVISKKSVVKY